MTLRPGQRFGAYRIERKLSEGGMGVVYLASHVDSGRRCALKLIREPFADDPIYRRRLEREAGILQRLDHRNVVPIFGAGEVDGVLYVATVFIVDGDLRRLLETDLDAAGVLSIFGQACAGLEAAHEVEILHRDVKPPNLLVEREGDGWRVYVADFGIAVGADSTRYTGHGAVGTPGFMSPECARGEEADRRADVYSLGCCLETLVGPKGRRGAVGAVIDKAAARSPDARYPTAMALYEAAAEALAPLGGTVLPAWPSYDPDRTRADTPTPPPRDPLEQPAEEAPADGARGRGAVVDRALGALGLDGAGEAEDSCLVRSRSNPRLVTAVVRSGAVEALRPHSADLSSWLASELGVDRVRVVLLPAGLAPQEVVRAYLEAVFGDHVLPDDFSSLTARLNGDLLQLDLSPRLGRLCDEDALAPLALHLGANLVQLQPIKG